MPVNPKQSLLAFLAGAPGEQSLDDFVGGNPPTKKPPLVAPADATFVRPHSPADAAEQAFLATRKKLFGRTGDLPVAEEAPADLNLEQLDRGLSAFGPDSAIDRKQKDIDQVMAAARAAVAMRKKFPNKGRTGPG